MERRCVRSHTYSWLSILHIQHPREFEAASRWYYSGIPGGTKDGWWVEPLRDYSTLQTWKRRWNCSTPKSNWVINAPSNVKQACFLSEVHYWPCCGLLVIVNKWGEEGSPEREKGRERGRSREWNWMELNGITCGVNDWITQYCMYVMGGHGV